MFLLLGLIKNSTCMMTTSEGPLQACRVAPGCRSGRISCVLCQNSCRCAADERSARESALPCIARNQCKHSSTACAKQCHTVPSGSSDPTGMCRFPKVCAVAEDSAEGAEGSGSQEERQSSQSQACCPDKQHRGCIGRSARCITDRWAK